MNIGKIKPTRYKKVKGKAWKILSDYVRMRDFIIYRRCVSCGKTIHDWKDGDAGHFISMGGHGALVGFNDDNVHLQCKHCNLNSSFHLGEPFESEMRRRGIDPDELRTLSHKSVKADEMFFMEKIEEIYQKFQILKANYPNFDYPDYL